MNPIATALPQIDWLGVALAFVASAVLAGVWFGAVVAKPYLRVLGRTEMPTPGPVTMVGPMVCTLVTVIASAVLVAALEIDSAGAAVAFSLVVGIGYLAAMTFQIAINPNFPHPLRYGALNAPFFVGSSVVTGLILVLV